MNIEEIRAKLRNNQNAAKAPESSAIKSTSIVPESKKLPHTLLFNLELDEEKPEQSEAWSIGADHPDIDINKVLPSEFINSLGLNKPEYDWREKTRNGRKSRKNFSQYILTVI